MSTDELVTQVVAGTAVIVALSYLLRAVARWLRQPEVIGQIFAGIALGPSLLGHVPGNPTEELFPAEVVPYISVLAQVALVPFLFAVACELDLRVLRERRRLVPAVATGAFVIPMLLGGGVAFAIGPLYTAPDGPAHDNAAFVMFLAVAMSVTAVPVLASIIRERGASGTLPGVVAMTSAGVIDALGWLFLASAILLSSSSSGEHLPLPVTLALFAGYLVTMWCVVRPLLSRWLSRPGARTRDDLPVVAAVAMASAWATAALELHVIFGAFVAGLIMPRNADGAPEADLVRPLQETGTVLLPVFFVISGLSVDISALTANDWALLVVLTVVAVVGKFGGGLLGARLGGMAYREASIVGVMLNTRGLTELIALNMGLQSGIIDGSLYTVLVLVALITTVSTGPALTLLRFPEPSAAQGKTGDARLAAGAPAGEAALPGDDTARGFPGSYAPPAPRPPDTLP